MSTLHPEGTVGNASLFQGVAYTSRRLFTLSGTFRDFDMFNVFTNSTSLLTSAHELVTLKQITSTSGSPPFNAAIAMAALNKQIIAYTPSVKGVPTFSSFDTTTGTWSGPGLMTGEDTTPGFSVPLATIIGGAVRALVLITLVVLLIIRHRRRRQAQQKS
ncbi:hypothetical protein BGX24_003255 [Mortierella sp. AD032]|nr:hypothetical protein BGX24_003255 [Mortierella sp. AD032]